MWKTMSLLEFVNIKLSNVSIHKYIQANPLHHSAQLQHYYYNIILLSEQRAVKHRPHVAWYFGKWRLFSLNTATVHTYLAFSGTKNGGFQIRSPGWIVLKAEIHCIRVGGQKLRFSNMMTSCLGSRLALLHIRLENAT